MVCSLTRMPLPVRITTSVSDADSAGSTSNLDGREIPGSSGRSGLNTAEYLGIIISGVSAIETVTGVILREKHIIKGTKSNGPEHGLWYVSLM
jgi:hypothetical protein